MEFPTRGRQDKKWAAKAMINSGLLGSDVRAWHRLRMITGNAEVIHLDENALCVEVPCDGAT